MSPAAQEEHPQVSMALSAVLALASLVVVLVSGGLVPSEMGKAIWVVLVALLANLAIVFWDGRSNQIETGVGFIPIIIAALAYGPTATVLTAVVSGLPFVIINRSRAIRRIGTRLVSGATAALLFASFNVPDDDVKQFIVAGFFCAMVYQALQLALTSGLMAVEFGGSFVQRFGLLWPHFGLGLLVFGPMAVAYAYLLPQVPEAILVATFAVVASHQLLVTIQRSRGFERLLSTMSAEIPGSLLAALDAADSYTAQHSAAVASYSYDIALARGYDGKRARQVHAAALLHDVGKIGVPDAVLTKPGRLDADEWALIQKHPELGANMVARLPGFEVLEPGIRHHHERIDGSGYPDRLAGDQIPEEAQVIAIADTYSAITTTRAYRRARPPVFGIQCLREDAESGKLNGELVELFIEHLDQQDEDYRTGTHTTLGNEVSRVRGWLDLFRSDFDRSARAGQDPNEKPDSHSRLMAP